MVTFEETMQMMAGMSEKEMKAKIEESKKICANYCGKCPTYRGTGETKLVFCANGKSDKIQKEKGCRCPECPLTDNMGLRWMSYCTRGSGAEQMKAEKRK